VTAFLQGVLSWLAQQDEDTLWVWHHKVNEYLTTRLWPTPESEQN